MMNSSYVRIDLIFDRPLLREVRSVAKAAGLTGHTLLPALGGEGANGVWSEDLVTAAQSKLVFMAVTSGSKSVHFLEALKPLLETHGLVVFTSQVTVVRAPKFE